MVTQNISDNHPALEILHDLENTAYYVDKTSGNILAQHIIQAILRWAEMMKVGGLCTVVSLF